MIIEKIITKKQGNYENLINYITDNQISQGKVNRVGNISITNCDLDNDNDDESLKLATQKIILTQDKNRKAKGDKTYHMVISFPQGEKPTEQQLKDIEDEVCDGLGYGADYQRISVVHGDTNNLHVHVAINKINQKTFKIYEPQFDFSKMGKIATNIEDRYGLQKVEHKPEIRASENRAKKIEVNSGEKSFLSYMKELAPELGKAQSWQEFHNICKENGVILVERGRGLSFKTADDSQRKGTAKPSDVNRDFSKSKLEKKFGKFQSLNGDNKAKIKQSYKHEPASSYSQNKKLSDDLYKIYLKQKEQIKIINNNYYQSIKQRQQAEIEAAKSRAKSQWKKIGKNRALKLFSTPNLKAEIDTIKGKFRQEYNNNKINIITFKQWLTDEAKIGNKDAILLLKNKQNYEIKKQAKQEATQKQGVPKIIYKSKAGTTISYRKTLTNERYNISSINDDEAMLHFVTKLQKFNQVTLTGSDEFKAKVVKISVTNNINLNFSDKKLEQQKRLLINKKPINIIKNLEMETNHDFTDTPELDTAREYGDFTDAPEFDLARNASTKISKNERDKTTRQTSKNADRRERDNMRTVPNEPLVHRARSQELLHQSKNDNLANKQNRTNGSLRNQDDDGGRNVGIKYPVKDRLYLTVPKERKEEVKKLGAKFDARKGVMKWYIPNGKVNGFDTSQLPPEFLPRELHKQEPIKATPTPPSNKDIFISQMEKSNWDYSKELNLMDKDNYFIDFLENEKLILCKDIGNNEIVQIKEFIEKEIDKEDIDQAIADFEAEQSLKKKQEQKKNIKGGRR